MKKVFAFICAMGIAAGASAQVKVSKTVAASNVAGMESVAINKEEAPLFKVKAMNAAKPSDLVYDTLGVYAWYSPEAQWGYTWFNYKFGPQVTADNLLSGHETIRFLYGSFMLPYNLGSGELGYYFPVGAGSWYADAAMYDVTESFIVGAATSLVTFPRVAELNKGQSMPFWFKVYDQNQISEQQVLTDHNALAGEAAARYTDVTYPTDPDVFHITDTAWIAEMPLFRDEATGEVLGAGDTMIWSSFNERIPVGDEFCLSVLFPSQDMQRDTNWNVTMSLDISAGPVTAEWPRAVYGVMRFPGQHHWRTALVDNPEQNNPDDWGYPEERIEGFIADESMQPNKHAAVFSMAAFNMFSDGGIEYEPYMLVVTCSEYVSNSPNTVDRYVQVAPVPAVDYVNITSSKNINRVEIYSLGGGLVKNQVVSGNEVTVNVSGLNSGMYIAKVYTESGVATKRIVVR